MKTIYIYGKPRKNKYNQQKVTWTVVKSMILVINEKTQALK